MLKIKVDFKSLFRRGIKTIENDSLVALITGVMGSGKTYYSIKKLEDIKEPKHIITNVRSYKSSHHDVEYITHISEIYDNHDKNTIFLIDELSKLYVKDSKIDRQFYSWLQQSRKHNRQVYLITQEYLQVPQWLRGVANYVYTTHRLFKNYCITSFGFPILDKDTMEWGLSEISIEFYKRNKIIAQKYDTLELINTL